VILTELSRDTHKNTEAVTLAWYRDGQWRQRVIDREVVANARSIVELAALGLPVNSNNANSFVAYIADFEAQNLDTLPATKFARHLGWQGDPLGHDGFLWGTALVTAAGVRPDRCDRPDTVPATVDGGVVHFRGADAGDDQIAEGFHAAGTLAGWLEAVRPLAPYPRVKLVLYASLAPALLPILASPSFILDLAGETSTGKTTALRVAASDWGNPDETSHRGATLSTWDGTAVWRERAPTVLHNLPFILDDTKRARKPEDVASTIYEVSQGRGRGRGSVRGLARSETWQTVLLTSGEQAVTSFTGDGGTRARVLTLWGSPFGARDAQTQELVRKLNQDIKCHYGHAGPRFVQYLLAKRERWDHWRGLYRRYQEDFERRAPNPVAGRLAAHLAVLKLTTLIAHEALALPWERKCPITPLWSELIQEASEADRAAAALRHVLGVAYANPGKFYVKDGKLDPPPDGWWGRWDPWPPPVIPPAGTGSAEVVIPPIDERVDSWAWIGFVPHRLDTILADAGFDPASTLRTWKDRGWIMTTPEANGVMRGRSKAKLGKHSVWLVKITRRAAAQVEDGAGPLGTT
jgi:hypothetical protein